ncbi:MAG: Hsp70 family protein [Deltaproteobacteria bacterium]|nr:Hsp70 family protein [Deltaproteobacteria bacterium]
MSGAVVGIDLGTTNTVVAVVRGGKAHVIADEEGHRLLPSVVSFHPNGDVLVGHHARERRLVDARNTVYSIKRLIGRSWSSDEVTRARARFPFELREGPTHGPLVVARGETYTLPEISAFVLRKVKAIAETALGEPVERAVVTVPASFNDLQRASTKVAAREAGLEVLRILNEPTAAALAYGFGKSGTERIAVYDFGGGTFDLTLLDLSGNVFEVIATAGDSFLGGDDIDGLIADRIALEVIQSTRFDPRGDVQVMERLRAAAEQIKIALSTQPDITVELRELGYGPGGAPIDLTFTMTREQLEKVARPLVDRSFKVCDDALQLARMRSDGFDNVILVGGSTRIPLVRRHVEEFFGKKPLERLNPDEVVAIGAAIQAAALTGAERRRAVTPVQMLDGGAVKASRIQTLGGVTKQPPSAQRPAPMAPAPPPRTTGRLVTPPLSPPPPPPTTTDEYPVIPGMVPVPSRAGTTAPLLPDARPVDRNTGRLVAPQGALSGGPPVGAYSGGPPVGAPPALTPFVAPPSTQVAPPPGALGATTPPGAFEYEARALPRGFPDLSPEPSTLPRAGAAQPTRPFPDMSPEPMQLRNLAVPELPRHVPAPPAFPPLHTPAQPTPPPAPPTRPPVPSFPPNELGAAVPLLIDVTPLTLSVETVSGWVDRVIPRNSPVPCAQTRNFTTSHDGQQVISIRVCQGEGDHFHQNSALGELELSGLRAARRGEVAIEVTFELDADGILQVRARDLETSRETQARMRLIGLDAQGRGRSMMPAVV